MRPALLLALLLTACPAANPDPLAAESGDPLCGTDQLAKLITGRAMALEQCCAPTPVKDCHADACEAIRVEYSKKFDAWERCP